MSSSRNHVSGFIHQTPFDFSSERDGMDIDSSITSSTRDRHNYDMASSFAAMSSYGYHNSTAVPSSINDSTAETIAELIQPPSIPPSKKLKWLIWNKSWSSSTATNEHLFTYVKLHNKFDDLWCINPSTLLGTRFSGMFCFSPFIWNDLAWSSLPEMKSPLNFRFSPKQIASSFYRCLCIYIITMLLCRLGLNNGDTMILVQRRSRRSFAFLELQEQLMSITSR